MGSIAADVPTGTLSGTGNGSVIAPSPKLPVPRVQEEEIPSDDEFLTVDQLVRARARQFPDRIIVSYPSSGIEYVDYTMRQLDVFAYRAACQYTQKLPMRESSAEKPRVVAMLGPSNLEYMISMLALTKLGHTVLFLSTRISTDAVISLLKTTSTQALIAEQRYLDTAFAANDSLPELQLIDMITRPAFEFPIETWGSTRLDTALDPATENSYNIYIIHSSGSTGLPKPIYQTHTGALPNYSHSMEMRAFITLPLFHNHGICNFYRAIYAGKSIHMYNAHLPLTSKYLTTILQQHRFEIFYGVPYALKLLAETPLGISLLRDLKIVMYGGSACPDELGDLLVENGVNMISHYGATEVGQLMMSTRPAGDKGWNYVRENDRVKPFLRWTPRGPNLFECCVLEGWPAKLQSNQPDGSYATKDLFEPHPTIPGAWKYIARLDDTLVLVNGEKFNPVALEGRIRCLSTVAEAVVFGAGRPYLGLAIIPASSTGEMTREETLDKIWPEVEAANETVDGFARISKSMVIILPHDADCPKADKGSIIRQAFYKKFAPEIEAQYDQVDGASGSASDFQPADLRAFLRKTVLSIVSKKVSSFDDDSDFFMLGMDSLQAIQLRSEILRTFDMGGSGVGQNIAFDYPSVNKLTTALFALKQGVRRDEDTLTIEEQMEQLASKYSLLTPPGPPEKHRSSVAVTGATGSLGAHVVALLARNPAVDRVFCLVRAENNAEALKRVSTSLHQRKLDHTLSLAESAKICALRFDQTEKKLSLGEDAYSDLISDLRAVIHCAWSVNFNLHLTSFEKDCILGTQHLMNLCLAAQPSPATFSFCSSVSTVVRAPSDIKVPEGPADFRWAQGMGYAQSKSVAERMCINAAESTGLPTRVLRIGQIIGDTQYGIWNATEAIPLMLQTSVTVGALPALPETPSWLPVDTVARAVLDITFSPNEQEGRKAVVTNVVNPRTFSWTDQLLPSLREAGLRFETVAPREWLRRLRESKQDPATNPPVKLIDFFASKYDKELSQFPVPTHERFETGTACSLSETLATAPMLDQSAVQRFIDYFLGHAWKSDI